MRSESVWRMLARHTRADAALIVLTAVVVALVTVMVALLPAVQRDAANDAVRAAAEQPGSSAIVSVPISRDFEQRRVLWPDTGKESRHLASKVAQALPSAFTDPVTTIVSPALGAGHVDNIDASLRFAYIDAGEGAEQVVWATGRAPQATATAIGLVNDRMAQPVVEVGLSSATAAMWDVAAGGELELEGADFSVITVRVTGTFDQVPPAGEFVSHLMKPNVVHGGDARVAGVALLSEESLPFARYVLPPGALDRTFIASPRIGAVTAQSAPSLVADMRALATARDAFDMPDQMPSLRTSVDTALEQALAGVRDSAARMAVVLAGVLVTAALLLVLGARELVDRRTRTLSLLRSRGVGVPAVGGVFAVESAVVAVVGVVLAGVVVAALGATTVGVRPELSGSMWAPAIAAALAPPVLAMATVLWGAAASGGGAVAASRLGGDRRARRRGVLRASGEILVVALAVVAAFTLRSRGAESAANSIGADAPVLAAPTLAAVVAGLLAVRLLPLVQRVAVALARRGTGAVALLAATKSGLAPLATTTVVVATVMLVVTAWSRPVAGAVADAAAGAVADAVPDAVAQPLAAAESLTSSSALVALAGMSVLAVVVVGAGGRRRSALGLTRVRVLGMAAGPARQAGAFAVAWPIAVAAVVAVVSGTVIAAVVLGVGLDQRVGLVGSTGGVAWLHWWPVLWPLVLGVLAGLVAAVPSTRDRAHSGARRSLGEQMRAY